MPEPSVSNTPTNLSKEAVPPPEAETITQSASEPTLTRRGMFRTLCTDIAHGAEWAALSAPLFLRLTLWSGVGQNSSSGKIQETSKVPYPKIDQNLQFPDSTSFHNLGVLHTVDFLEQHGNHLRSVISASDIIVLEAISSPRSQTKFFDALAEHAKKENKPIYILDNNLVEIAVLQSEISNIAAAFGGMILCNKYIETRRNHEPPLSFGRRTLLRMAAWGAALTGFPSPPVLANNYLADGKYDNVDISYIADGRSVLMLDMINTLTKRYPNSKIVTITGDGHASLFTHYLKNEVTQYEFSIKRKIYGATYGTLYGKEPVELR